MRCPYKKRARIMAKLEPTVRLRREHSAKEVARMLGVTKGTVYARLRKWRYYMACIEANIVLYEGD